MKALTVWQPWASLIVEGAKPYEFRGWRCPPSIIGQRIVIHAAARKIDFANVYMLRGLHTVRNANQDFREAWAETCLIAEKAEDVLQDAMDDLLPLAAGIGTAVIGEPRIGTEIAEEFGVPRANDSDRDQHANWGWPMLDVEKWVQPVPMRGAQGFWNWPTPEALAL